MPPTISIVHFPSPPDTYSDTSSTPALSRSAPSSPDICPITPTPSQAVLPNHAALVKNREALLASLSAAKLDATTALAEATIAQAELDGEVEQVQDLINQIAKFAGHEYVGGVVTRAQAVVAGGASAGGSSSTSPGDGNPSLASKVPASHKPSNPDAALSEIQLEPSIPQPSRKRGRSPSLSPLSSSDFEPETKRIRRDISTATLNPTAPVATITTLPITQPVHNSFKRRRDSDSESQEFYGQARAPSGTVRYSIAKTSRQDSGRRPEEQEPERKRMRTTVVEGEGASGLAGMADVVNVTPAEREGRGTEGNKEDEESDDDDSSYVTSGSDIGSRFSSTSGSSFPSDDGDENDKEGVGRNDDADDDDGPGQNVEDGAGSPAIHPTGRPAVPVRYTHRALPNPNTRERPPLAGPRSPNNGTRVVMGFENGGMHALAVCRADEGKRRVQRVRDILAANAARHAVASDDDEDDEDDEDDYEEEEEEEEAEEAEEEDGRAAPGPATEPSHIEIQPAQASQSQLEAGPSRPRRVLTREPMVLINPDGTAAPQPQPQPKPQSQSQPKPQPKLKPQPQPQPKLRPKMQPKPQPLAEPQPEAGPSAPRARPLTRDRERIRKTQSGTLEVFVPEDEAPVARMPREGATMEEWRNYGVQTYPYAADLWEIKMKAGWRPDDRWS